MRPPGDTGIESSFAQQIYVYCHAISSSSDLSLQARRVPDPPLTARERQPIYPGICLLQIPSPPGIPPVFLLRGCRAHLAHRGSLQALQWLHRMLSPPPAAQRIHWRDHSQPYHENVLKVKCFQAASSESVETM